MDRMIRCVAGLLLLAALVGCNPAAKLIKQGNQQMLAKRPAEAARLFAAALKAKPKLARDPAFMAKLNRANGLAHYQAGYQLANQKRWDEAIDLFSKAVAADPGLAEAQQGLRWAKQEGAKAHHQRALGLADKGDLNGTIRALQRALELDPSNGDAKDALENTQEKKGASLSKAQSLFVQARELGAKSDWGKASEALRAAIAANPNHILSRVMLAQVSGQIAAAQKLTAEGRAMLADRRLERAQAALRSALGVWPTFAEAKGLLEEAGRQHQSAETLLQQATQQANAKDWEAATATAAAALSLFPYHAAAEQLFDRARREAAAQHLAKGNALLGRGAHQEADAAFLSALTYLPDAVEPKVGLARTDVARGDAAQAKGLWGSALLWYRQATGHHSGAAYAAKLSEAQARVLARVRFGLAIQVHGAGGAQTTASAALQRSLLAHLTQQHPDVIALAGEAPPFYGLTAELAALAVTDTVVSTEQRVHRYTIARQVPNPDIPRLQQLLAGARADLHHLRREFNRPCPTCQGRKQLPCTHCRARGNVACAPCNGSGHTPCSLCKGSGKATGHAKCAACNGAGSIPCRACRASGWLTCRACKGKPAKCTLCGGAGKKGNKTCPKCKGSGNLGCAKCGGIGKRKCPACGGSKRSKCTVCNGSGKAAAAGNCPKCGGGQQCAKCGGKGRHACPICRGSHHVTCSRCKGSGRHGRVDQRDVRRKEREVDDLEYRLRTCPAYVTEHIPAEWPYTVRRHQRRGTIDVGLWLRNIATAAVLGTDRVQRHVDHFDNEILNANPDIGLSPDPLRLPTPESIGAVLTDAAAGAVAKDAIARSLAARQAELKARADALVRGGQAEAALEAQVDHAWVLGPTDPKAADALLAALDAARRTHNPRTQTLAIPMRIVPGGRGALLGPIPPDSPAAKAGLLAGDILVAVDGRPLATPSDAATAIAAGGTILKLTLQRTAREVVAYVRLP